MNKHNKLKLALPLAILILGLFALPTINGSGAAATAAKLELSADSYVVDTMVTIRIYDIAAAGASCQVYFTYDLSGTDTLEAKTAYANMTVYLGSEEDEWVYTMVFPAPTAGSYVRVHVCGAAGSADLASDTIYARTVAQMLPTNWIIALGIDLMIIGIIVGIVGTLGYLGYRKIRR